jgi:hypothetical protein
MQHQQPDQEGTNPASPNVINDSQQPEPKQKGKDSSVAASLSPQTIQQYLDENQWLIQAIVENQNLGRLEECTKYQARLQQNLLFLSSLVDFM